MKRQILTLSRQYQAALRNHLKHRPHAGIESARGLGSQGLAAGLQTLDLAKLHEQILITDVLPRFPAAKRAALIKQAGIFFAAAITPMEVKHRSAQRATAHLKKFIETLSQRTVELAASNMELSLEVTQRKAAEDKLKKSERHYSQLLTQSDSLQEQLRRLSRQILTAQEEERKKISRELHDVIAQTLTGINVRLATLKRDALADTKGLDRNIARTQRLVEQSVSIVHQFARELRPAVLDDLGLVPALHSFMKNYTARTGIRTRLTVFAGIENLDAVKRTVLYRIAQEALTNVALHARASQVHVKIQKLEGAIGMTIRDNGKGFQLKDLSGRKKRLRLGLLGMRERAEMVNGRFQVESAPGEGTTIEVQIPLRRARRGKTAPAPLAEAKSLTP